jgi:mRNA interferase RelE/StbE
MEVKYETKFQKDLREITDQNLLKRLRSIIEECKNANGIHMIHNLKKLKGYKTFYRIRVGDYRIGIEIVENTILQEFYIGKKSIDIFHDLPVINS